jgi:transposase-like protein
VKELFAGDIFDREIIVLCVRWYLRYKLSLRDLVEMMSAISLLAETAKRTLTRPAFSRKLPTIVGVGQETKRGMDN